MITPLLAGDVTPEGIDLALDCSTPMAQFLSDDSFQAGELSFSQYLRRLSSDDKGILGLPIFLNRGFRQRCFYVRPDSGLTSFPKLAGKRIGIDAWPATGHTWSRGLLREAGVDLSSIQWSIGPIEDVSRRPSARAVAAMDLPPNANVVSEGKTLVGMLLTDELDVLIASTPPRAFYAPNSSITRLFHNFRQVEEEYAERVGFFPCHHVIGVRSSILEKHPWIARSLFAAFDESRKLAEERRFALADTSPWLLEDLEHVHRILGPNWQMHGVEPNQTAIATLCEEIYAQGIISTPIDPSSVFADFERLLSAA